MSDVPMVPVMRELAAAGIDAGYLVPTPTGLKKGIMDAHASLRAFLQLKGIHNFETQPQGDTGKVVLEVLLVERDRFVPRKMSLYRPRSKEGDPRIWIYGLGDYAQPLNLLFFVYADRKLYVVNASREDVYGSRNVPGSGLAQLLQRGKQQLDEAAVDLLARLQVIAALGFVDTHRPGSTGIGFTLETLLGIAANSSTKPDFRGIEIKASRMGSGSVGSRARTRVNLFSQIPNWQLSECKSGIDILKRHGYNDPTSGRLQLYTQLDTRPNSLGFFLKCEEDAGLLKSMRQRADVAQDVVCWQFSTLIKRLEEKHNRTFWVKARQRTSPSGAEQFHYVEVVRTEAPLSANFATLVEIEAITFDFTLSLQDGRARDHGYLFKIHPSNLDLLFPKPASVTLC